MALSKKPDWRVALLLHALINLTAAGVLTPASLKIDWAYFATMWICLPAIGVLTTYIAVRKGLNNYVAWFVPCTACVAAHWLIIGYPPSSPGMALLNAGVCLVAAAAAQVKNERDNKR